MPGHGLVISFEDPYVVHAAGYWLKLWQRRRRALWRRRSPWGVRALNVSKVLPCLKTAASSSCSAARGTE
jgi:hypothetical protein